LGGGGKVEKPPSRVNRERGNSKLQHSAWVEGKGRGKLERGKEKSHGVKKKKKN